MLNAGGHRPPLQLQLPGLARSQNKKFTSTRNIRLANWYYHYDEAPCVLLKTVF